MKDEDWKDTEKSNGHRWGHYKDWKLETCRYCGMVRRADDKNSPCKGKVKLGLREE